LGGNLLLAQLASSVFNGANRTGESMYQFREVSPKIQHLRQLVRDRVIQPDAEQTVLRTEAEKLYENVTPIIKRPLIMKYLCERLTLRVDDEMLFALNKGKYFMGATFMPDMGDGPSTVQMVRQGVWSKGDDGLWHSPPDAEVAMQIAEEDVVAIEQTIPFWQTHILTLPGNVWQPDGYRDFVKLGCSAYDLDGPVFLLSSGHIVPGWQKLLTTGFGAIRQQALDWMAEREGNLMGDDLEKYLFYKSIDIICEALTILTRRYAQTAAAKAQQSSDPELRARYEQWADSLEWIAEKPARTFWEALNLVLIYEWMFDLDTRIPSVCYGRIDYYTWPFLEQDLQAGRLTLDQAQELIDGFILQSTLFYGGGHGPEAVRAGIEVPYPHTTFGNSYKHITIGGMHTQTGEDSSNPVTYMVLEAMKRLVMHDPPISLRVNHDTPDELWECAIETSKTCGGLPLFQNDEVFIPAIIKEMGWELEDARDYCFIGCQEVVSSGKDYPAGNGISAPFCAVHNGVLFTMAINNGINPFNGEQVAPEHQHGFLYEMESLDQLKAALADLFDWAYRWFVTMNNYTEYIYQQVAPHASLSMTIDGCMQSGRDCTAGGAKYNSFGGTAPGLATIADSLTTIKYMCFDKQICTTRELYDAVMANWDGYEELRQRVLNEVPHFGNDDPYADMEMKWVVDTYVDVCRKLYSKRSKIYKTGLYGAIDHLVQGYHTWATPDGRKSGTALADAASPAQGRDVSGPMAVFLSSTCYDQTRFMDGIALNLRIHPSAVNNDEGVQKLADMTKTYFDNGGVEVQYNIVGTDTLKAAQQNPDEYRDLIVRIAGYSAYFVELPADEQEDIISRTENQL
jgi:formate C-acetyltransferase